MSTLSEATVNCGMYGYVNKSSSTSTGGRTWIVKTRPLLAAGTLSRVHLRLYGLEGAEVTSARIGVVRADGETPGNYNVIGQVDITSHINAAAVARTDVVSNHWEYDSADTYGAVAPVDLSSITGIASGDFLALWTSPAGEIVPSLESSAADTVTHAGNGNDVLVDADPVTINTDLATYTFMFDAFVTTTEAIIFDGTTYIKDDVIQIPSFTDEAFQVILEGVVVPDDESLKIDLTVSHPTLGREDGNNVLVDMSQAAGLDVISIRDENDEVYPLTENTYFENVTYVANDKYTIIRTFELTRIASQSMKANFVNYVNGQGPLKSGSSEIDIAMKSLSNGAWVPRSSGINVEPRSITLTQPAGTAATVERVVVTRKPVVIVGDSYTSADIGTTTGIALANIGAKLETASRWLETLGRYVILGGVPGNRLLFDDGNLASIGHRFDGADGSLWDVPNSDVIIANGPSINDVTSALSKPTTLAEGIALGEALGWEVAAMASKAVNNGCQVTLNEMCYLETGNADKDAFTDQAVTSLNETLALVSYQLQIPIAKTASTVTANAGTYYHDDGMHLSDAGYDYVTTAIIAARENNSISPSTGGSGKRFSTGGGRFSS